MADSTSDLWMLRHRILFLACLVYLSCFMKNNRNRSRVQRFRGSGLFLASFHPCLEIYEP